MFKSYKFIVTPIDKEVTDVPVVLEVNPITLITPLSTIDFKSGEEEEVMSGVLLEFIDELLRSFTIIKITQ